MGDYKRHYLKSESPQKQRVKHSITRIIKTIKMHVMSRNIKKQVQAINFILRIINTKKYRITIEMLISAEIPGLLCDVINNHNPGLIEKVCSCLMELAADKKFYEQKHSTVVVETTSRIIKILASNGQNTTFVNNISFIQKGIELLVTILSRIVQSSTALPALCKYLQHLPHSPSSNALKAVSFVFAVLSLPYSAVEVANRSKELYLVSHRLVRWCKSKTSLSKAFTHHPAMLYWFLGDLIKDKFLKKHAIKLWLKDKSPTSLKLLEDLVLESHEAVLCLLDVIECCSQELFPQVMSLLKIVLARDKMEKRWDTSEYIWRNLSNMLFNLAMPDWRKRSKNVCCVIYLACIVVPPSQNASSLLRLAQQLIGIYQKISSITWEEFLKDTGNFKVEILLSQLFKLTKTVTHKMIFVKDFRGLKIFLEESSLHTALLASLDSDDDLVIHPALQLLTFLQKSQKTYNIQVKDKRIVMGAERLLKLMSTKRAYTAFYAAKLFSKLQTTNPRIFITLSNDMSIATIYSLYLEFLNHSVREKGPPRHSWKCKNMLLQYCRHYNSEMELLLLTHPLNILALQPTFNSNGIGDTNVVEYLQTYVTGVREHKLVGHRSYERAICRDPISTILYNTAKQLLTKDWPRDSLQAELIYQISTIGGNIPSKTIDALKAKIPQRGSTL